MPLQQTLDNIFAWQSVLLPPAPAPPALHAAANKLAQTHAGKDDGAGDAAAAAAAAAVAAPWTIPR